MKFFFFDIFSRRGGLLDFEGLDLLLGGLDILLLDLLLDLDRYLFSLDFLLYRGGSDLERDLDLLLDLDLELLFQLLDRDRLLDLDLDLVSDLSLFKFILCLLLPCLPLSLLALRLLDLLLDIPLERVEGCLPRLLLGGDEERRRRRLTGLAGDLEGDLDCLRCLILGGDRDLDDLLPLDMDLESDLEDILFFFVLFMYCLLSRSGGFELSYCEYNG